MTKRYKLHTDSLSLSQPLMVRAAAWLIIAWLVGMTGCLYHTWPIIEPYGPWTK